MPNAQRLGHPFLSLGLYAPGPWRDTIRTTSGDSLSKIFTAEGLDASLEAAFLLKQTGIPIAAWTRNPVPQDVISVMAATMWGSMDTMIRTLGGTGPESAMLEVAERRILAARIEPNWTLLLIAPRSVGRRRLGREASRIFAKVSRARKAALRQPGAAEIPEEGAVRAVEANGLTDEGASRASRQDATILEAPPEEGVADGGHDLSGVEGRGRRTRRPGP
jgi:predicted regulator of Ras-like GTPase activity (Roadblock/LC7/MglB family)